MFIIKASCLQITKLTISPITIPIIIGERTMERTVMIKLEMIKEMRNYEKAICVVVNPMDLKIAISMACCFTKMEMEEISEKTIMIFEMIVIIKNTDCSN